MPKKESRTFDVYEAIGWEQRVHKEENALLDDDAVQKEKRKRERQRRDNRLDARIRRLEEDVGSRRGSSTPNLMRTTDGMPEHIRQLRRWPVTDSDLISMKPVVKKEEHLVPKLRFEPRLVDAMWVPGTHKILSYKPEFSIEAEPDPETITKPWRLPPAGQRPAAVTRVESAAVEAVPGPVIDDAAEKLARSMGRSRDSRTQWASAVHQTNEVSHKDHLGGTASSLRPTQLQSSAASFHCRFAESATSLRSSGSRQVSESGRRQRVNTLAVAGGSALPRISEAI